MTQRYGGVQRREAAELRARAGRVRKHARALSDDPAAPRLERFADELDATAEAMEEIAPENAHATDRGQLS